MPTITVTAPDSAMAMDEVVRQLGSDAYILSTTQQDGLVQIKASLDPLKTAPRRPKAIQTVFEQEMEKQFSVSAASASAPSSASATLASASTSASASASSPAPTEAPRTAPTDVLRLVSIEGGIPPQADPQPEQALAKEQAPAAAQASPAAPILKVAPPQPEKVEQSTPPEPSQSFDARLKRIEEHLALNSKALDKPQVMVEPVPQDRTAPPLVQHELVDLGFDRALIDAAIAELNARGRPSTNAELVAHLAQTVVTRELSSTLDADVILVVGPSGCGKTTLAAKFASLLSEMMEARIVRLVSMEDTNRPQPRLLPHYAHMLNMPVAHWPISQPTDWGPIARNTLQIIDMACTTDEAIGMWPELQEYFGDLKVQVVMAIPSGLAANRLAHELDKASQLDAQIVLTKLDETEFSVPEVSQLITKSAKVGWLTGTLELSGNLAKATCEIMEQYLLGYVIEQEYDTDASTDAVKSDMDAS